MEVDIDKLMNKLESTHNVDLLKELLVDNNVKLKFSKIDRALGVAINNTIFIDFDKVIDKNYQNDKIYFIILHELAHTKRIKKKKIDLNNLFNSLSEDEYSEFIINEEIFADRYARLVYYQINREIFPTNQTQGLHLKSRQERYKLILKDLYTYIKENPNVKYTDLIKQHIHD